MALLEAENVRVRREVALTRLALQATDGAAERPLKQAEPEEPDSHSETARADVRTKQLEAISALESELRARTAAEAPDRGWTAAVERSVQSKIAGLAPGNRPVFESARCSVSLCTVVVSHEQPRAHADLLTALQKEETPGFGGRILMRRHPNPVGGYRTTLYLSKVGEPIVGLSAALSAR
jgi:hypothetical protein